MANGIGIGRLRVVKRNVVIVALVVSSVSPEQEYSKYLVFGSHQEVLCSFFMNQYSMISRIKV